MTQKNRVTAERLRALMQYSCFKGVFWHKRSGKWVARIGANGKQYHIGTFDAAEVAYKAYCEAAAKLHTHNPSAFPSGAA